MKKFNKNKILNRILYLIFILLIILSSVYIAKSFISKKEAENERDLLNSIDIEDVKEIEEKYKNSKTNDGNNNESEKQKNDNKEVQNEDNINNEENQKSQEKSAEETSLMRKRKRRGEQPPSGRRRGIQFVVTQQRVDKANEFPGSQYESALVRRGFRLRKLSGVECGVVRVVLANLIGRFYEVVTEVTITRVNHRRVVGIKLSRLIARPGKASELGQSGLAGETIDIANFGNNASGVNSADPWYGSQRVGYGCDQIGDGLVEILELGFVEPDGSCGNGQHLVDRAKYGAGQTVRRARRRLNGSGEFIGVGEFALAMLVQECGKFFHRSVGDVIYSIKVLDERHSRGAEVVGKKLLLRHAGELEEKRVCITVFLSGKLLGHVQTGAGKALKRGKEIIHVSLPGANATETEAIGNNKGVHWIGLGQIGVGLFEVSDLPGIEDEEPSVNIRERMVLL